jgi:hypothetical protein
MYGGPSLIGGTLIVLYFAALLLVGVHRLSRKDRLTEDNLVAGKRSNQWPSSLH